jgi:hypothetical protein
MCQFHSPREQIHCYCDTSQSMECHNDWCRDFGNVRVEMCCRCVDELEMSIVGSKAPMTEIHWFKVLLDVLNARESKVAM